MPMARVRFTMLTLIILAAGLLMAACAAASPTAQPPTPVPAHASPTAAPPTPLPPSATPQPSATDLPSATPVPATATPLPSSMPEPLATEDFSAWCLPEGASPLNASDPANPPANARFASMENGALEVNNLPYSVCVFLYTFNGPAPEGLTMNVYDAGQKTPWLAAGLVPVEGSPNQAAVNVRHEYIVVPPFYDISYEFALTDAAGQELRRDQVNLHRWKPEKCWNGQYPNLKTGLCPLPQDLHPWDAGYLTPIPTFPPED